MFTLRRLDTIAVAADGGLLSIVDRGTGELVRSIPVPPGCYVVGALIRSARRGQALVPDAGVQVLEPATSYTQRHEHHFQSTANPTYRVTNAMRIARNMEASLRRMELMERVTAKRHEALIRATENHIPVMPYEPSTADGDVEASSGVEDEAKPVG